MGTDGGGTRNCRVQLASQAVDVFGVGSWCGVRRATGLGLALGSLRNHAGSLAAALGQGLLWVPLSSDWGLEGLGGQDIGEESPCPLPLQAAQSMWHSNEHCAQTPPCVSITDVIL